ncbi:MAG: hypothetical protein ACXWCY_13510 [Burkholderiales bacterium]
MELKTFIAETLVAIQEGVQTAIERTKDTKGAINPCFGPRSGAHQLVQLVEFDLSVTVGQDGDGHDNPEIEVLTANLGGKAKKLKDVANLTRIQFAIPILPATQTLSGEDSAEVGPLRRASKVASGATDALHGSSSVPDAATINPDAQRTTEATQEQ